MTETPTSGISPKVVIIVPAMLPMVDKAYSEPEVLQTEPIDSVISRMAKGDAAHSNAGGQKQYEQGRQRAAFFAESLLHKRLAKRKAEIRKHHDPHGNGGTNHDQQKARRMFIGQVPADEIADTRARQEDGNQAAPHENRIAKMGREHAAAGNFQPHQHGAGPKHEHFQATVATAAARAVSASLVLSSGDRARSDFTVLVPFDAIDTVPIVRMLLLYFYCDPIGQTGQPETGNGTVD